MRGVIIVIFIAVISAPAALFAGAGDPPHLTDNYIISFGPRLDAIPGDPSFFLPIKVSFSQPTVRISLFLTYDPTVVTPVLLAPNIFVQGFTYDLSRAGKIKLLIVTDLPPPPIVPPISGDTTVAWIMFRITTRFIGYDFLTTINYFEDPGTPAGDNFIVLQDNEIIMPPVLVLIDGEILVRLPLYGDINLNTLPWEIGDAVTFLNFFMGAPFNRQQYANADCNLDGVQASISDLVYLLRVISYDSLEAHRPGDIFAGHQEPEGTSARAGLLSGSGGNCDIVLESPSEIGGAAFTLDLGQVTGSIEAIDLYPEAGNMELAYSIADNVLRIAVVDWSGRGKLPANGRLLSIRYSGDSTPTIVTADFSDAAGSRIEATVSLECATREIENTPAVSGLAISGYPNPFNGAASLHLTLPADGHYELAVYDVLGRRIKNLINDYRVAGSNDIIWDGTDDVGAGVCSGTYFVRLMGDTGSSTIKMHLLK